MKYFKFLTKQFGVSFLLEVKAETKEEAIKIASSYTDKRLNLIDVEVI